jgi:hypothetical protein
MREKGSYVIILYNYNIIRISTSLLIRDWRGNFPQKFMGSSPETHGFFPKSSWVFPRKLMVFLKMVYLREINVFYFY